MAGQSRKSDFRLDSTEELAKGYAKQSREAAKSGRMIVLLCAVLVLIADAGAMSLMLYKGLYFPYILFPSILAAADLLFLLASVFTNFRFRYAKIPVIGYLIVAIAVSVLFIVESALIEEKYMTNLGIGAFLLPHILIWVALLWAARLARIPKFKKRKVSSSLAAILIAAMVGCYGIAVVNSGIFGQGATILNQQVEVVYRYVDAGYYTAEDIVDGKGDSITIADTFNGLPVSAIDCNLFSKNGIKNVAIAGSSAKTLLNKGTIENANDGIAVTVNRTTFDDYQNTLFRYAVDNLEYAVGDFIGNLIPDIGTDEIYVSFNYDFKTLPQNAQPIPVNIVKRTESATLSDALGATYRNLYEKRGDLEWNYQNNQRKRLTSILNQNGEELSIGSLFTGSHNSLMISYEKVYRVIRSYGAYAYGGAWTENVYATESMPNGCLDYVRDGCTAVWRTAGDRVGITTEKELFNHIGSMTNDPAEIALTAEWSVNAPNITTLTTDKTGNSFVYGTADATLRAEAAPNVLALRYQFVKSGEAVSEDERDWVAAAEFSLSAMTPNQSGVYQVVCRATDKYDKRLYKDSVKSIGITVQKKTIDFDWSQYPASGSVYDRTPKPVAGAFRPSQLVGDDTAKSTLNVTSVTNAGFYTGRVTLTADTAEKYTVSSKTVTVEFRILPKTVTIDWKDLSFGYNGAPQKPSASANGVILGDTADVTVSGDAKNAGEYTATASIQNRNYTVDEDSVNTRFVIAKATLSFVWDGTEYVYRGASIQPGVTSATGVVGGENESEILSKLSYGGGEINAGDYTATAEFPEAFNYTADTTASHAYRITPAALRVTADDQSKTYDGAVFSSFTATPSGLVGEDTLKEVATLTFGGAAAKAVDAFADGYAINVVGTAGEKNANYTVTYVSGKLTIEKRALSVTADDVSKEYDGTPLSGFTSQVSGLASTDTIAEVGTIGYGGSAVGAKDYNADNYGIEPYFSGNTEKYYNYEVKFTNAVAEIQKKDVTVTAVGGQKTYDGTVFDGSTIDLGTLVGGDLWSDVATFILTGKGVTESNAGTYSVAATLSQAGEKEKNYNISYKDSSVTIEKRALIVTANNVSKEYDNAVYAFSNSDVTVNGLADTDKLADVLSVDFQYLGNVGNQKDARDYTYIGILGTAGEKYENYQVTYTEATLTITPKDATVTAQNASKIYDGGVYHGFTAEISGLAEGDLAADLGVISYRGEATTAISYRAEAYVLEAYFSIENAKFGNYNFTYQNGSYAVAKRAVTITAVGGEKVYDGQPFTPTFRADNLVAGESAGDLGTVNYGGTGASAVNASDTAYPLTVTLEKCTAAAENYTITYADGAVKINRREITLQKRSSPTVSKSYDGTTDCAFAFVFGTHYGVSGAVESEITGATATAPVYNAADVNGATEVSFTITAWTGEGYLASNYTVTGGDTLTFTAAVAPCDTAVEWSNTSVIYTGDEQSPVASAKNIGNESLTLNVTTGGGTAAKTEAGEYIATATCADGNYRLTGGEHSFTINMATVSVVWDTVTTFTYDGDAHAPTAAATGVKGETIILTFTVKKAASIIGAAIDVGSYTATAATVNGNYALTNTEKGFVINAATVAVVWGGTEFTYNGDSHIPTASATGAKGETIVLTLTAKNAGGVTVSAIAVGSYTATAATVNGNYSLTNTDKGFVINAATVAVVWGGTEFTYNGDSHIPTASATGAKGETIILTLTVKKAGNIIGAAIDVGSYTATAATANGNYTLTETEKGFVIAKKKINAVWNFTGGAADGSAKAPIVITDGQEYSGDFTVISYTYYDGEGRVIAENEVTAVGHYRVIVQYSSVNYELTNAELSFELTAPAQKA